MPQAYTESLTSQRSAPVFSIIYSIRVKSDPSKMMTTTTTKGALAGLSLGKNVCQRIRAQARGKAGFSDISNGSKTVYLHIGPSGDCWTGSSIFAAKHLQPDYVKSIELRGDMLQPARKSKLLEMLQEDMDLSHEVYDTLRLPKCLLDKIRSSKLEEEEEEA